MRTGELQEVKILFGKTFEDKAESQAERNPLILSKG